MSKATDRIAADAIRAALVANARTSDPGLNWEDLVDVLHAAGFVAARDKLRPLVGFTLRRIRAGDATTPGLPVICDSENYYRLAIDRADGAEWSFRLGRQAVGRVRNAVSYVDTATTVHGHLNPTGPPLWVAARAQLDAAHTTIQLAHHASFG